MTAPTAPSPISTVSEIVAPSPKVSGGVLYAPIGTPLPENATDDLDPAFKSLGRVKDDGIKRTEDRASSNVYDWGGNRIAILQTQFGISVMFDLLQLVNAEVQQAAHGEENVDVDGENIAVRINPTLLDVGVWVFDSYYGKAEGRLVLPYARPTKVDGPNWTHKELASYKLTLESMPDDENNHAYEYWTSGR